MAVKLTEELTLSSLLELLPESKEVLRRFGYERIERDGVEEIVNHRLTIKGFMNLFALSEKEREELFKQLLELYNSKYSGG
ncbi:MAG: hypothetical protein GXO03_04955 [Aquificae bacterium]|nr:hypothetical protein [Aquificota bacterium]